MGTGVQSNWIQLYVDIVFFAGEKAFQSYFQQAALWMHFLHDHNQIKWFTDQSENSASAHSSESVKITVDAETTISMATGYCSIRSKSNSWRLLLPLWLCHGCSRSFGSTRQEELQLQLPQCVLSQLAFFHYKLLTSNQTADIFITVISRVFTRSECITSY